MGFLKGFKIFLVFFVMVVLITVVAAFRLKALKLDTTEYKIISPLAAPVVNIINNVNKYSLENTVREAQKDTKGTYNIAIKHFTTGEIFYDKEKVVFESASLYKLWVMATAYEQIKQGTLKEDEVLQADIVELNKKFDIPEDVAEQKTGAISLTTKQAIFQMITISHNYAALLLSNRVGLLNIKAELKKYGLENSSIGYPPKTTAYDTALFFEKLYKGEIVDAQSSIDMIEILKKQQLNDRIPKYLPNDIQVAHKTGEIDFFKHDGGIVFTNKGDYVFVVLSQSESPSGAAERIAKLSEAVYNHFQKHW